MKHIFTLSLCFLALSLSVYGQVPDYIPTDGLVAWYPFNGNANDESGNELHGVAQDVTYDNSSCQGAQVVRNDGSGVVEIPNNVISPYSLTIAGRFTLNTLDDQTLFRNGNGGEMHVVYNQFQDNQIRFSMKFSNNQWASAGVELPFLDEWYSFVATYNTYENKLSIYLSSGESETVDTPDTGLWNYSIPTQISRYCNGDVDEISLWSRDLNENEISFYLNNLSCESCADVLACNYYPNSIDNVDCDYSCCPGPGCCGVGMNWNSEIGECEITNPTDTNLDGCTNLTDLMDILSAYGDCAMVETNYSLSFDGMDDYISLSGPPASGDNFSISSKFKIDDLISGHCIYGHRGYYKDVQLRVDENGILQFNIYNQTSNLLSLEYSLINADEWMYVVATFNGSIAKIYLDGEEVATQSNSMSVSWNDASNGYWIGGGDPDWNPTMLGKIDRLSIWNKTLSIEEVQLYMSNPPSGDETDISSCWNFNEGTGVTLIDQTGNGNDGVINGATWSTDVPTAP